MLISGMDGGECGREAGDDEEYSTASQLFDIMAKDHNFDQNNGDSLSHRDLVLLYKNLDLGTQLMSSAMELKRSKPNQHVETVVYNDDEDSDESLNGNYSNEDLYNMFLVNKERLELLNSSASNSNYLCNKKGKMEIKPSSLSTDYNTELLFNKNIVTNRLTNVNLLAHPDFVDSTRIPTSLLDYICCRRLEENYNFYMENMINYVQHTIEQLRRISNGDYLTDKAKEKWQEVQQNFDENYQDEEAKVLATSTSIPLHIERKATGLSTKWDDIVHSEVDIRSLSKILEKNIIIEVPKLLEGSYTLFSKCCADNVVISCKRQNETDQECVENRESHVEVVFQLKRSESGNFISDVNSIMILKSSPSGESNETVLPAPLALPYNEEQIVNNLNEIDSATEEIKTKESEIKDLETEDLLLIEEKDVEIVTEEDIIILEEKEENCDNVIIADLPLCITSLEKTVHEPEDQFVVVKPVDVSETNDEHSHNDSSYESCTNVVTEDSLISELESETSSELIFLNKDTDLITPDDLPLKMQMLNMQTVLPEETSEEGWDSPERKKSPKIPRIKSPYENKSHLIEENKRKKLLEIREKREKKKLALTDKIVKNKHTKGGNSPQASSSVTKLSITNKSFYNSIYGQSLNVQSKDIKDIKPKALSKSSKIDIVDVSRDTLEDDGAEKCVAIESDRDNKKYIDRSYYLDDIETEMMQLKLSSTSLNHKEETPREESPPSQKIKNSSIGVCEEVINVKALSKKESKINVSPVTPKNPETLIKEVTDLNETHNVQNKALIAQNPDLQLECRQSIDKIYDLMKTLTKSDNVDQKHVRSKFTALSPEEPANTFIQGSESGTSLKHRLTEEQSSFSFESENIAKKTDSSASPSKKELFKSSPKVRINAKPQIVKNSGDKPIKINTGFRSTDPLRTINDIIHEINEVQTRRHNRASETIDTGRKRANKDLINAMPRDALDSRNRRRTRSEQSTREITLPNDKSKILRTKHTVLENRIPINPEKLVKKRIDDIIDEEREARGEAVKGPTRVSRINMLAQPKKSYIKATNEENQMRYGRNVIPNRATKGLGLTSEKTQMLPKSKHRRGTDAALKTSIASPPPPASSPERVPRRSTPPPAGPRRPPHSPAAARPQPTATHKKPQVPDLSIRVQGSQAIIPNKVQTAKKTRAPYLPSDFEFMSVSSSLQDQSSTIGNKLHQIVNNMISNFADEDIVNNTQIEESEGMKEGFSFECALSVTSDYPLDIFEDKNVLTAIEDVSIENAGSTPEEQSFKEKTIEKPSSTELHKLEDFVLKHSPINQNRLRMKNLTLTPKHSMKRLILLQSGDTGSILLKSSLSKNFDDVSAIRNGVPALSKTCLDWNFTSIPKQVTTVGYAFSQYNNVEMSASTSKLVKANYNNLTKYAKSESAAIQEMDDRQLSSSDDKTDQEVQAESAQFETLNCEIHSQFDIEPKSDNKCDEIPEVKEKIMVEVGVHVAIETEDQNKDCVKEESNKNTEMQNDNPPDETNQENIDCSNSLDVLTGLLNEIQKITSCQSKIASPETFLRSCEYLQDKELETIFMEVGAGENAIEKTCNISVTSLDKLRQLETDSQSIYSLYMADNANCTVGDLLTFPIVNVKSIQTLIMKEDKKISSHIISRECVHRTTDVPSMIIPVIANRSTVVTRSLCNVASELTGRTKNIMIDTGTTANMITKVNVNRAKETIDTQKPALNKVKEIEIITKENEAREISPRGNDYTISPEYDPVMRMKRDILVTVYSMLVFTVFAALSLPEFYRV